MQKGSEVRLRLFVIKKSVLPILWWRQVALDLLQYSLPLDRLKGWPGLGIEALGCDAAAIVLAGLVCRSNRLKINNLGDAPIEPFYPIAPRIGGKEIFSFYARISAVPIAPIAGVTRITLYDEIRLQAAIWAFRGNGWHSMVNTGSHFSCLPVLLTFNPRCVAGWELLKQPSGSCISWWFLFFQ